MHNQCTFRQLSRIFQSLRIKSVTWCPHFTSRHSLQWLQVRQRVIFNIVVHACVETFPWRCSVECLILSQDWIYNINAWYGLAVFSRENFITDIIFPLYSQDHWMRSILYILILNPYVCLTICLKNKWWRSEPEEGKKKCRHRTSFRSLPFFLFLPCPSLPLTPSLSRGYSPPHLSMESWERAVSSPNGFRGSPADKQFLVHFGLKITLLL